MKAIHYTDRLGKKRVHIVPTKDQLLATLDTLCPICRHNESAALRMWTEMISANGSAVVDAPSDEPQHAAIPSIIGKAVKYAKAVIGPNASDALRDLRLSLCDNGAVFCPTCKRWAQYAVDADEWKCHCGWTMRRAVAAEQFNGKGAQPCPFRIVDPAGHFCARCGCGKNEDAELHNKAAMLNATCPRGLWPTKEVKSALPRNGDSNGDV